MTDNENARETTCQMDEDEAAGILAELAFDLYYGAHGRGLVVGLSGGPDSTLCLLAAWRCRSLCGNRVRAVHCIHGLDADDPVWLAHCQKLCCNLNIELETPRLNIVIEPRQSPEECSRAERYRALIMRLKGDALVLGHQRDDQVESLFLSLKRGSGPLGLAGMRRVTQDRRGLILRPLLHLPRQTVEAVVKALGFDYVLDISNTYQSFERNFLRLSILPKLRERFSGFDAAVCRSMELCALEHNLARRVGRAALADALEGQCLNLEALELKDRDTCTMLVREYLIAFMPRPPSLQQVRQVMALNAAGPDTAAGVRIGDLTVRCYRRRLYVTDPGLKDPPAGVYRLHPGEFLRLGDYLYALIPVKSGGSQEVSGGGGTQMQSHGEAAAGGLSDESYSSDGSKPPCYLLAPAPEGSRRHGVSESSSTSTTASPAADSGALFRRVLSGPGRYIHSAGTAGDSSDAGGSYSWVQLDFTCSGQLRLKPEGRRHSRELKKLCGEYALAPWQRRRQCVVRDQQGRALGFGNVFACAQEQAAAGAAQAGRNSGTAESLPSGDTGTLERYTLLIMPAYEKSFRPGAGLP